MAKKRVVKAKKAKKSVKKSVSRKKQVKKAVKTVKKAVKKTYSKAKSVPKKIVKTIKKAMEAPLSKLSGKANMLVTFDPNHRGTAMQELKDSFKAIGEKVQIADSGVEGLFRLSVSDPRKAAVKIAGICRKDPSAFVATHHYIPIDKWCKSEVSDMQSTIKSLLPQIGMNDKWKLNLAKRQWDKMRGDELIHKLTEVIDRPKVDLDNPQKIVQVEIIGTEAGISVLTPTDIIDVQKIKAER